jgi:hypothetical protein
MHIVFQSLIDHQAYVTYSYIYFVLAILINAGIKMIIYHIFSPTAVNYMSCKKGQRQLIFSVNYKLTSQKPSLVTTSTSWHPKMKIRHPSQPWFRISRHQHARRTLLRPFTHLSFILIWNQFLCSDVVKLYVLTWSFNVSIRAL